MSTIVTPQLRTALFLTLVTSSLTVTAAQAAPFTNADAIAEAQTRVKQCDTAPDKNDCRFNRTVFLKEYQNAYAGDYLAQKNIAFSLWKGRGKEGERPIIFRPEEACAWQTLALETHPSGHTDSQYEIDLDDQHLLCYEHPSGNEATPYPTVASSGMAKRFKATLYARIKAHKVHLVNIEEMQFDAQRDHTEENAGDE